MITQTDLGAGRGWLDTGAAKSIHRIDRELGHPLQITEAGRSWDQQNVHFQHYLKYGSPIALDPDTPSVHQEGEAIDSDEAQEHLDLMERHGWKRTVYRNGKLIERWHFEYFIDEDQHRNDPDPHPALETPGEDIMRVIESPAYIATNQRILMKDNVAMPVPAGWVQDLITHGKVPFASYPTNDMLTAELSLFYMMQGLDQAEADKATAKVVEGVLGKANAT